VLELLTKIRNVGPHFVVLVPPSLRRRTQKSFWVRNWNHFANPPFELRQVCSCKLGNGAPGCHFAYYVGSSFTLRYELCDEVASLGGTPEATIASLGATLIAFFSSLSSSTPAICRPVAARAEVLLRFDAITGSRQAPHSAHSPVCPRADSAQPMVGPRADSAQVLKAPTNLRRLMSKGNYVATCGGQALKACGSQLIGQTLRAGGRQASEACNACPIDFK
jgi:hypothetical protein